MGHLLGVSTAEQDPALQRDALTAAGCARLWIDVASGTRDNRPQLAAVLEQLLPGDTLVVWRLDRLGRSLRYLIDTAPALVERGVGFRSLQESIDTTTSGGQLVFHLFGALAEFECDLIRDRTLAGRAARPSNRCCAAPLEARMDRPWRGGCPGAGVLAPTSSPARQSPRCRARVDDLARQAAPTRVPAERR